MRIRAVFVALLPLGLCGWSLGLVAAQWAIFGDAGIEYGLAMIAGEDHLFVIWLTKLILLGSTELKAVPHAS